MHRFLKYYWAFIWLCVVGREWHGGENKLFILLKIWKLKNPQTHGKVETRILFSRLWEGRGGSGRNICWSRSSWVESICGLTVCSVAYSSVISPLLGTWPESLGLLVLPSNKTEIRSLGLETFFFRVCFLSCNSPICLQTLKDITALEGTRGSWNPQLGVETQLWLLWPP